jgi:hypothetical protein
MTPVPSAAPRPWPTPEWLAVGDDIPSPPPDVVPLPPSPHPVPPPPKMPPEIIEPPLLPGEDAPVREPIRGVQGLRGS